MFSWVSALQVAFWALYVRGIWTRVDAPSMGNPMGKNQNWEVHYLLETHWMKAQLSWVGVQSIRHPLNEKGAQSNGWNPQPSWCTVCWKPIGWKPQLSKWVHHGFHWIRPIGRNPQLSGCTILRKLVGWRPQLSGCTTVSNGWNPQLSGCAPSIGNLLDEDQWTHWMGAPWFSNGWDPLDWVTKTLNHKTGKYDTAIFQRMRDNKNSARLSSTSVPKLWVMQLERGGRQQNTTIHTLQKWEAKQRKKLCS